MDMKTYFSGLSPEQKKDFAQRVKTSVEYLRQIASGHRKSGLDLALLIEHESKRAVTVEELSGINLPKCANE